MKKHLSILLVLFLISQLYAETFFLGELGLLEAPYNADPDVSMQIYSSNGEYHFIKREEPFGEPVFWYDSIKIDDYIIDEDGFPVYHIFGKDIILLCNGNRVCYIDKNIDWNKYSYSYKEVYMQGGEISPDINEFTSIWSKNKTKDLLELGKTHYAHYELLSNGVILNCKSNLSDKNKFYSIKNIQYNFGGDTKDKYGNFYNSTLIPWAENEKDYGKDVQIDIEFVPNDFSLQSDKKLGKCKDFLIMNGYVDFFRRDLFKKNNRVKTIFVESTDNETYFSFETVLKDTPDFQKIELPRYSKSIKITIKDVYKGTLYNDTCLSGILTIGKDKGDSSINNESNLEKNIRISQKWTPEIYKRWHTANREF